MKGTKHSQEDSPMRPTSPIAVGIISLAAIAFNGGPGSWAAEPPAKPVTLSNVEAPPPITPDEPIAKSFSPERAAHYLDTAALHWIKTKNCTACHTMLPYVMARPALAAVSPQA